MRKHYLRLVPTAVALATGWQAYGQGSCPTNGIETHPATAVNPQLPGKQNVFEWAPPPGQPNYPINRASTGRKNYVAAPYYQTSNVTTEIAQLQGAPDIYTSGWQLVKKDDGYTEGPGATPNQVGVDNPYVIIYNKYTGTLRVFWSVGSTAPPANFCNIEMSFVNNNVNTKGKSGLLNHISGIGVTLEDTPSGSSNTLFALKNFPTTTDAWFMADFPMDYDPCSCMEQTTVHFAVKLISQADVKLSSVSTGTLASINNGSGSMDAASGRTVFGGIVNGANTLINGVTTSYNNPYDFRDKLLKSATGKEADDINKFAAALTKSSFAKSALSSLPYVGAALDLLSFFVGGGSDGGPQAVSVQPMSIDFNTETSGSITTTYQHTGTTFATPGSAFRPNQPDSYASYNEVLGVMNMLQRPNFKRIDIGYNNAYPYGVYDEYGYLSFVGPGGFISHTWLLGDLSYVLNPASGLHIKEMKAALSVKGNLFTPAFNYSAQQALAAVPNGALGDFTIITNNYGNGYGGPSIEVATPFIDAACLKSQYFSLFDAASPRNADPATDPNGQYQYTTDQSNTPPFIRSGDPLHLKLLVTLTRDVPCATCQDVVLLLTYPISETTLTSASPGSNPGVTDPYPADDTSLYGTLPACSPGTIPDPASAARITDFCKNNVNYTSAIALRTAPPLVATHSGPAAPKTTVPLTCYPNPATGVSTVQFATTEDGYVKVELVDMVGKHVATIEESDYKAGVHKINLDTNDLAAGLYNCILQTSAKREVLKISVVK